MTRLRAALLAALLVLPANAARSQGFDAPIVSDFLDLKAEMDTDGNGSIDANEVVDWYEILIRRFDANRNGRVDPSEFTAGAGPFVRDLAPNFSWNDPGVRDGITAGKRLVRLVFRQIDINGDGVITPGDPISNGETGRIVTPEAGSKLEAVQDWLGLGG